MLFVIPGLFGRKNIFSSIIHISLKNLTKYWFLEKFITDYTQSQSNKYGTDRSIGNCSRVRFGYIAPFRVTSVSIHCSNFNQVKFW